MERVSLKEPITTVMETSEIIKFMEMLLKEQMSLSMLVSLLMGKSKVKEY